MVDDVTKSWKNNKKKEQLEERNKQPDKRLKKPAVATLPASLADRKSRDVTPRSRGLGDVTKGWKKNTHPRNGRKKKTAG